MRRVKILPSSRACAGGRAAGPRAPNRRSGLRCIGGTIPCQSAGSRAGDAGCCKSGSLARWSDLIKAVPNLG